MNIGKYDFSQFFMMINFVLFGDFEVLKVNVMIMFDCIWYLKYLLGIKIMILGDWEYWYYDENLVQGVSIDLQMLMEMQ